MCLKTLFIGFRLKLKNQLNLKNEFLRFVENSQQRNDYPHVTGKSDYLKS